MSIGAADRAGSSCSRSNHLAVLHRSSAQEAEADWRDAYGCADLQRAPSLDRSSILVRPMLCCDPQRWQNSDRNETEKK